MKLAPMRALSTIAWICGFVCVISSTSHAQRAYAYITSERSGDITVIDTRTLATVHTFHVNGRARGIKVSADGRTLYVAVSIPIGQKHPSSIDQDRILALDAASGRALHRYNTGVDPERLALDPTETHIFVAQEDAGTASIYDLKRDSCIASVVVGLQPEGIMVSPDSKWAYVTSEGSNSISVIDARKRSVKALFFVDQCPRDVAFLRSMHRAYVACEVGGSVAVIDSRTHQVLSRIVLPRGSRPMSIAVNRDESRIYVSNGRGNTVAVIDTRTNNVIASIPTGSRTWGIAITPNDRAVFAANSLDNTISVIDTRTNRVTSTLHVAGSPWGIAIGSAPADITRPSRRASDVGSRKSRSRRASLAEAP
jgi:YVTN family beta-propeller protein